MTAAVSPEHDLYDGWEPEITILHDVPGVYSVVTYATSQGTVWELIRTKYADPAVLVAMTELVPPGALFAGLHPSMTMGLPDAGEITWRFIVP